MVAAKKSPPPEAVQEAPKAPKPVAVPAPPAITPKKHDFLRYPRYAAAFVGGTVTGTLDGIGKGGRKLSWVGMGVGALAVLCGATGIGLLPMMAFGWAAGLATGAVGGGLLGALTGGAQNMGREHRKNKYSDDLLERAKAKSKPTPHVDYRQEHRDYQQKNGYMLDRIFQQDRENDRDVSTYFRDSVAASRHGHQHGQGV